jgi:hypothetical protein
MLKVYVAHSGNFDYKTELYTPLRISSLSSQYHFVLPHESNGFVNSKEIIKKSDLVMAEVSHPSTGVGIELGWADSYHIPILCFYKQGTKLSGSLKAISSAVVSYSNPTDMLKKIEDFLSEKFSINQFNSDNPTP